jgi:hypothetical protein
MMRSMRRAVVGEVVVVVFTKNDMKLSKSEATREKKILNFGGKLWTMDVITRLKLTADIVSRVTKIRWE